MKKCFFTICATNYIGLSKILGTSVKKYYRDVDFFIIVADEPEESIRNTFDENILIGKDILDINSAKWCEMAFKYDLTEFCTAIKPHSFIYFLNQGYEKCIYFDPDILAFSSIAPIFEYLDHYSAVVTPHITQLENRYTGELMERHFLHSGIFNFGFFAVRSTPKIFNYLKWWASRLEECCYSSKHEPFFTDQKWANMLPCYLQNDLCVSSNLGMNFASWNFHEREILIEGNDLFVRNRITGDGKEKLIFVHFSGYKYKDLISGNITRIDAYNYNQYPDTSVLFKIYSNALNEGDFNEYIDCPYTYNYFEGGEYEVNRVIRRLYRGLCDNCNYTENPFKQSSSLYLTGKKKGIVKKVGKFKSTKLSEVKGNLSLKLRIINRIFSFGFRLLGSNKYFDALKLLREYSKWENHYFLIDNTSEYSFHNPKM